MFGRTYSFYLNAVFALDALIKIEFDSEKLKHDCRVILFLQVEHMLFPTSDKHVAVVARMK